MRSLVQYFPTGVPCHTCVPLAMSSCAMESWGSMTPGGVATGSDTTATPCCHCTWLASHRYPPPPPLGIWLHATSPAPSTSSQCAMGQRRLGNTGLVKCASFNITWGKPECVYGDIYCGFCMKMKLNFGIFRTGWF